MNPPLTFRSRRGFLTGLGITLLLPVRALRAAPPGVVLSANLRRRIRVDGANFARWRNIVGHHSATVQGNAATFDAYHRNVHHMENGLAYHFVIGNGRGSRDGQIEVGPRWTRQLQGGHVHSERFNQDSIGICLVGNFEEEIPTPRQIAAFTGLVEFLRSEVLPETPQFLLHREIPGERTLCPGRAFPAKRMHRLFG